MPVLNFPDAPVESSSWGIETRTRSFTSDLTGVTQVASLPGAKWVGTLVIPQLPDAEIRIVKSFLARLNGQTGRFYYTPVDLKQLGTRLGAGVVNGAGQAGSTLNTRSWTGSQALLFAEGDYFEVNGELKMVTVDAASDISGNATIEFAPPLRKSPPDAVQILHVAPRAIMKLADDKQAMWSLQSSFFAGTTIKIEEALDA